MPYRKKRPIRRKRRKTYIKRKGTTVARSVRLARPMTYSFVRCIESVLDLNTLLNSSGFATYAPTFTLTQLPEYSSFATLFRQGRLAGVRTTFIIQNNIADMNNVDDPTLSINNQQIEMRCWPRMVDTTLPSTMLEACNIRQAKTYNLVSNRVKPLSIYQPTFITDIIGTNTFYYKSAGSRKKYPFVPLEGDAPANSPGYNLAYALKSTSNSKPPSGCVIKLRHYLYVQFRGQTF